MSNNHESADDVVYDVGNDDENGNDYCDYDDGVFFQMTHHRW